MVASSFKTVTLGDLIDSDVIQVTTGFPFGGHNVDGEGVPHIRPFNVGTDGEIHLDQIKWIPAAAATGKPTLQRNDIVFNNTNTKELVGKCALWSSDEHPVYSNHMTRIRVIDDECDPAYLSFAILHHWMAGKSEMLARSHVAQASITGSRFREIEVPWPDVAVQRKIGTLIQWVRAASRAEAEQLGHAKALKDAVMSKLFTRGLRGEPQKDTEIGPVPESWGVVELGSLCLATDQVDLISEGDRIIHYIDVSSVSRESLKVETTTEYRLKDAPGRARKRVRNGDVIFATIRPTLLRAARIDEALDNQVCSTAFCVLRTADPELLGKYVFYAVQRPEFLELLERIETGASYPAVTDRQVKAQPIPLPPPDEQREIVAILEAIDRKIALHRDKRRVLEDLFKALLHKLMTGEIRVTDLDLAAIENASESASSAAKAAV